MVIFYVAAALVFYFGWGRRWAAREHADRVGRQRKHECSEACIRELEEQGTRKMTTAALRYEHTPFSVGLQSQEQPLVALQAPTREGGEVVLAQEVHAVPQRLETALMGLGPESDARAQTYERIHPTVVLPGHRETDRNLLPLQQWEGIVTRVAAEEFTVTLRDLTNPGLPEEEATVPIAEITREDRRLLVPGAVLYWSIGYQTIRASGQIQRVSDIRLRRLPVWSARDLERVDQRANALRDKFGLDDPERQTEQRARASDKIISSRS